MRKKLEEWDRKLNSRLEYENASPFVRVLYWIVHFLDVLEWVYVVALLLGLLILGVLFSLD